MTDKIQSTTLAQSSQVRNTAIEECAKLLDEAAQDWNRIRDPGMANNARSYARKIRTLAAKPPVEPVDRYDEAMAAIDACIGPAHNGSSAGSAVERFQRRIVEMLQVGWTGFHFTTGDDWHSLDIEEKCAALLDMWDAERVECGPARSTKEPVDVREFVKQFTDEPQAARKTGDFDFDNLADLVSRFSAALLEKLKAAEAKYGHNSGWMRDDWVADCRHQLNKHLIKGDPRDVAAYCAFMWHHGWPTSASYSGVALLDLLIQAGYDESLPHPECFKDFSYMKLAEILTASSPVSRPHGGGAA